jgi:hypothetical protein
VPVELRDASVLIGFLGGAAFSSILASESIGILSDRYGLRNALLLVPSAFLLSSVSWVVLSIYEFRRRSLAARSTSPLSAATAQPA